MPISVRALSPQDFTAWVAKEKTAENLAPGTAPIRIAQAPAVSAPGAQGDIR
jgi:heme/copper-type cytochrome/quinol oxidase subunit 2